MGRTIALAFLASCIGGGLASACASRTEGGRDEGAGGDGDGDGDGDREDDGDEGDADGEPDRGGDADADTEPDVCDEQQFDIRMEPVRVQIVLDQSSSMGEQGPWQGGTTSWDAAIEGLEHMLDDPRNQDFAFGLDAFPDGTLEYFEDCTCDPLDAFCMIENAIDCTRTCDVDLPPYVAIEEAAVSGPAILDYLGHDFLPGTFTSTPLLEQMRWYDADRSDDLPELYANDGASYLLVISDGDDTCSEGVDVAGALAEATAHVLETYGIRSIAIGFGDTEGAMAEQLNAIAANGGSPFGDFFAIDEEGALQEALDAISSGIATCVYDIEQPDAAADPELVNFYFDDEIVGHDPGCTDGWRWAGDSTPEAPRVEFCGPTCERLGTGEVERIDARFGCATVLW